MTTKEKDLVVNSLIRKYLETKGLQNTLAQFKKETGHDESTSVEDHKLSLDKLVADRLNYIEKYEIKPEEANTSISGNNLIEHEELFEHGKDEDVPISWNPIDVSNALAIHLSSGLFQIDGEIKDVLFVTFSNKDLFLIDLSTRQVIVKFDKIHGNVLGKLCYCLPQTNKILCCDMNASLKLFEITKIDGSFAIEKLAEVKIHNKLVVDFRTFHDTIKDERFIFSIGWDFSLSTSKLSRDPTGKYNLSNESSHKLLTVPNAIEVGSFNKTTPLVFLTRANSTKLSIFTPNSPKNELFELARISLNTSEFSSNEFTPMSISLASTDFTPDKKPLIGITTSHTPFLRILLVESPNFQELLQSLSESDPQNHPLELFDNVVGNYNTLTPQDRYSQPKLEWTFNNGSVSGCWIPGDDGILRCLRFKTGQVFGILGLFDGSNRVVKISHNTEENLNSVHGGQRIKCFVSHRVGSKNRSVLVTAGIDKELILWE